MKNIKMFGLLFVCVSAVIVADESATRHEVCAKEIEVACYNVIDDLFSQARESIAAKQDIIDPEWLNRKEIKEIQHLMSDACLTLVFDNNAENVIPPLLETYIEKKIREELNNILGIDGVSLKRVDEFFDLSKIMCALAQGSDCRGMMRTIKNENFSSIQNLKVQKKVRQQEKREEKRQLRERILLGAHPRK